MSLPFHAGVINNFSVTIHNTSTKSGAFVSAVLKINITAQIDGADVITPFFREISFESNQSKGYGFSFSLLDSSSSDTYCSIKVKISDPNDVIIKEVDQAVHVEPSQTPVNKGSILVNAIDANNQSLAAIIKINYYEEVFTGTAPYSKSNLEAGSVVTVEADLEGYQHFVQQGVNITMNSVVVVNCLMVSLKGNLSINSDLNGSSIRLEGIEGTYTEGLIVSGVSPDTFIDLASGDWKLTATPPAGYSGYPDYPETIVHVDPGGTTEFICRFTGYINVDAIDKITRQQVPADIYLDGWANKIGTVSSGVSVSALTTIGQHSIFAIMPGYQTFERYDVIVLPGGLYGPDIAYVTCEMVALKGTLRISAEDMGTGVALAPQIDVDDIYRGSAPLSISDIDSGYHKVKAVLDGYVDFVDYYVFVNPGGEEVENCRMTRINASLGLTVTDKLSGEGLSGAKVYIDGIYKGYTNQSGIINILSLGAGIHNLRVTMDNYQDYINTELNLVVGYTDVECEMTRLIGGLAIFTMPMGGDIYLDGVKVGNGYVYVYPLDTTKIYHIHASKTGYEDFDEYNVVINPGGNTHITCTLIKIPGAAEAPVTITERIDAAEWFLYFLLNGNTTYSVMSEYPGIPFVLKMASGENRTLGEDKRREASADNLIPLEISRISELVVRPNWDSCIIEFTQGTPKIGNFSQPQIKLTRTYSAGDITYKVQLLKYESSNTAKLYFREKKVFDNLLTSINTITYQLQLNSGWNEFVYTGPIVASRDLLASIRDYPKNENWLLMRVLPSQERVFADNIMYTGSTYWIYVENPCTILYRSPVTFKASQLTGAALSSRYTMRHGSIWGKYVMQIMGMPDVAAKFAQMRTDFGFTYDLYDPLFGQSLDQADDFMFQQQAFHDKLSVWRSLPVGISPPMYPYLSKIQVLGEDSVQAYIIEFANDYGRILQAIHILNKYKDPNHSYNQWGTLANTTPFEIACNIWNSDWNGVGICPSIGGGGNSSTIRTGSFWILATLLGYRYGMPYMRQVADTIYKVMMGDTAIQAGMYPLDTGYICYNSYDDDGNLIEGNNVIFRPQYNGAFYSVYHKITDELFGEEKEFCNAVTVNNQLAGMVDSLNMPPEEPGPICSNSESTGVMYQAMRVYAAYALNNFRLNSSLLPSPTCKFKLIGVTPSNAKFTIDGVSQAGIGEYTLSAGRHVMRWSASGYYDSIRVFEIPEWTTFEWSAILEQIVTPPAAQTVTFYVALEGFGGAKRWAAQYYDPVTHAWQDSGFWATYECASFYNVHPGGQVAYLIEYSIGGGYSEWAYAIFDASQPTDGNLWFINYQTAALRLYTEAEYG